MAKVNAEDHDENCGGQDTAGDPGVSFLLHFSADKTGLAQEDIHKPEDSRADSLDTRRDECESDLIHCVNKNDCNGGDIKGTISHDSLDKARNFTTSNYEIQGDSQRADQSRRVVAERSGEGFLCEGGEGDQGSASSSERTVISQHSTASAIEVVAHREMAASSRSARASELHRIETAESVCALHPTPRWPAVILANQLDIEGGSEESDCSQDETENLLVRDTVVSSTKFAGQPGQYAAEHVQVEMVDLQDPVVQLRPAFQYGHDEGNDCSVDSGPGLEQCNLQTECEQAADQSRQFLKEHRDHCGDDPLGAAEGDLCWNRAGLHGSVGATVPATTVLPAGAAAGAVSVSCFLEYAVPAAAGGATVNHESVIIESEPDWRA